MTFSSARPIDRDDFDAALVPSFREAVRGDYAALAGACKETWDGILASDGSFIAGAAVERDCPLCGGPGAGARLRFVKLGMRIVTCQRCSLIYSRDVLSAQYDRDLYLRSAAQGSYRQLKRNTAYRSLEETKCRYILQQVERHRHPPGRLLDVGAGSGRLLAGAIQAGWQAVGVEADPVFAAEARALELPVEEGFFPEVSLPGSRFDVITMLDILEHAIEPVGLLRAARERLSPGGVLAIQVPNVDSLLVRLEGPANSNFCHGHWNHFTASTLERAACTAGFEPLEVTTIISELDRVTRFGGEAIAQAAVDLTGKPPPAGGPTADWVHIHRIGYKLLGYFRTGEAARA
jgi:SAM-dependent methyltransferase